MAALRRSMQAIQVLNGQPRRFVFMSKSTLRKLRTDGSLRSAAQHRQGL